MINRLIVLNLKITLYIVDAQIKSFFSQVSQLFIACSAAAPSLHIMINVQANSQRLL